MSFQKVLLVEDGFFQKSPNLVIKNVFNSWHYKPWDSQKTRQYYENILIETGSVLFKHYSDPKDPTFITHSTAQILKVLRPIDWPESPNTVQKFPSKFTTKLDHCPYFNYWDYQQAWFNAFLLNNKYIRHSWLMYFKYGVQYKFPVWFQHWWNWFGPIRDILPEKFEKIYDQFVIKFLPEEDQKYLHSSVHFFSKLSISWITSWEYAYQSDPQTQAPMIVRKFKAKWWDKFNDDKYNSNYLVEFFNKNSQLCKSAAPDQDTARFLQAKSTASSSLAQAKTKKEYKQLIAEILSSLESDDEEENSSTSSIKTVNLAEDKTKASIMKTKKK